MSVLRSAALAAAVAAAALTGLATSGSASTFFAWVVTDVSPGDRLNVRASATTQSRILVSYRNGTRLSLTGECTGGLHLDEINGWPSWRQRQAVRYRWCAVWVDPGNGIFRQGWVYGRYIRPDRVSGPGPLPGPGPGTNICGGFAGFQCGANEYCSFPAGAQCGAADQTGTCKPRPEACTMIYQPVCGCDGQTYGNSCQAAASGVSVLHPGPC